MSISLDIPDIDSSIEELINYWKTKGFTENDRIIRDLVALDIIKSGKLLNLCETIIEKEKKYSQYIFYDRENEESFKEFLYDVFHLNNLIEKGTLIRGEYEIKSLSEGHKIIINKAVGLLAKIFGELTREGIRFRHGSDIGEHVYVFFEDSKEYIRELLKNFDSYVPISDADLIDYLNKRHIHYLCINIKFLEDILEGRGVNVS